MLDSLFEFRVMMVDILGVSHSLFMDCDLDVVRIWVYCTERKLVLVIVVQVVRVGLVANVVLLYDGA